MHRLIKQMHPDSASKAAMEAVTTITNPEKREVVRREIEERSGRTWSDEQLDEALMMASLEFFERSLDVPGKPRKRRAPRRIRRGVGSY